MDCGVSGDGGDDGGDDDDNDDDAPPPNMVNNGLGSITENALNSSIDSGNLVWS